MKTLCGSVGLTLLVLLWSGVGQAAPTGIVANVAVRPYGTNGAPAKAPSASFSVTSVNAPFSMTHQFEISGRYFLVLVASSNGFAKVVELDAAGRLVGDVGAYALGDEGFRGATVVRRSGLSRLHLFATRSGLVRRYDVRDNGTIDLTTRHDETVDTLRNKNLFSAFAQSGDRRVFAVDTFGGGVSVRGLVPSYALTTTTFSNGWTNVDHRRAGGSAYRLLYKEVGNPFLATQSPGQPGRITIVRLGLDGLTDNVVYNRTTSSGLTSVRFVDVSPTYNGTIRYNQRTGRATVHRFTSNVPSSSETLLSDTNIGTDFDALESYRTSYGLFVIGVQFDSSVAQETKLAGAPAARLAECIHQNLSGRTVGYQLAAFQNGEIVMNRAYGERRLSPASLPMRRDTRLELSSTSKVMTAITAMALAEDGLLDLDAPVGPQLDPAAYPPGSLAAWTSIRTPRDLMAMASGVATGRCSGDDATQETDCSTFLQADATLTCSEQSSSDFACTREYINASTGTLREVVEAIQPPVRNTSDYFARVRSSWLDDVFVDGASCLRQPDVRYFRICQVTASCTGVGDQTYEQRELGESSDWATGCGAGGWDSSAQDLAYILEALEAKRILSDANTEAILDVELRANYAPTALGFDRPTPAAPNTANVLGKNGSGGGATSYMSYLEGGGQSAIIVNTGGGALAALRAFRIAYPYAIDPVSNPCRTILTGVVRDSDTAGTALEVKAEGLDNERFVVAMRDASLFFRMSSWTINPSNGAIERQDTAVEGRGDRVDVMAIDGEHVVAAYRDDRSRLRIVLYTISASGQITRRAVRTEGQVSKLELVALGHDSAEFAVVLQNGSGRLQIIAYDVTSNHGLARRGSYYAPDEALAVAATNLSAPGRLVTAIRTPAGRAQLTAFDVSPDGLTISRRGSGRLGWATKDVRLTTVRVGSQEFVVSAYEGSTLTSLSVWTVSTNGNSIQSASGSAQSLATTDIGSLRSGRDGYLFVPHLNDTGRAVFEAYVVTPEGRLETDGTIKGAKNTSNVVDIASRRYGGRHFIPLVHVHPLEGLRVDSIEVLPGSP